MATDPNPRSHPPFRRTKKAPDIGLTLTAKIPFAVNLSWRTPSILGVDERTVGRDKDVVTRRFQTFATQSARTGLPNSLWQTSPAQALF